jgi:3-oxoacyl-[acyl-carrier protein] reductase
MAMSNAREFEGRVALITGSARNLGRAIAEALAQAGAAVVINSRSSKQEMEATAAAINAAGGKAIAHLADITDADAVNRMVQATIDTFGKLDILVNNAVSHSVKAFQELSFEDWRRTMSVILDGTFHCTQACVPHIVRCGGGSIINMGGAFGHMPHPGRAATSAAKAGLAGLTRALALELAAHNINVNYVSPGPANTVRETPSQFDMKRIPLGRLAEPSEVVAMVKLLCSPNGRYITGQTIHINGGLYMNS